MWMWQKPQLRIIKTKTFFLNTGSWFNHCYIVFVTVLDLCFMVLKVSICARIKKKKLETRTWEETLGFFFLCFDWRCFPLGDWWQRAKKRILTQWGWKQCLMAHWENVSSHHCWLISVPQVLLNKLKWWRSRNFCVLQLRWFFFSRPTCCNRLTFAGGE